MGSDGDNCRYRESCQAVIQVVIIIYFMMTGLVSQRDSHTRRWTAQATSRVRPLRTVVTGQK